MSYGKSKFSFLRHRQTFPFPSVMHGCFNFSTSFPTFVIVHLFYYRYPSGCGVSLWLSLFMACLCLN